MLGGEHLKTLEVLGEVRNNCLFPLCVIFDLVDKLLKSILWKVALDVSALCGWKMWIRKQLGGAVPLGSVRLCIGCCRCVL